MNRQLMKQHLEGHAAILLDKIVQRATLELPRIITGRVAILPDSFNPMLQLLRYKSPDDDCSLGDMEYIQAKLPIDFKKPHSHEDFYIATVLDMLRHGQWHTYIKNEEMPVGYFVTLPKE